MAQLPGAGIWLLGGERTWAQSQPWDKVPAQLGQVLALPPSAKTAHVSARMRRHTQTHTQPVFAPSCKGAPGMPHKHSHRHTHRHSFLFPLLMRTGKQVRGHTHGPHIHTLPHDVCKHCAQRSLSPVFLCTCDF